MGHIGERIRKAREAKGLSQGYVADRLRPAVVHTTIGDIERRADLKVTRAREIAAILEIDERLVIDDPSDLDADDVVPVVRRESLRLFTKAADLTKRERQQYERIVEHPLAPKTVAGWYELRDLIQRYLGRSPDATPVPQTSDATPTNDTRKKRMVKADVVDIPVNRTLRRAG